MMYFRSICANPIARLDYFNSLCKESYGGHRPQAPPSHRCENLAPPRPAVAQHHIVAL